MITAAALCPAPPLLARELTGAEPVLPELRQACHEATLDLLRGKPDLVVVVGVSAHTQPWDSAARFDLTAFAPGMGQRTGDVSLPLPLGIGDRLLDEAGFAGRRMLQSVGLQEPAEDCAALGAKLAGAADPAALLVLADGSARRGLKAPGHLDERSFGFDAEVERAVRAGELARLLALDAGLADELMATGRPAWQVLAGALNGRPVSSAIRYCDDPFGVAYLVASLSTR